MVPGPAVGPMGDVTEKGTCNDRTTIDPTKSESGTLRTNTKTKVGAEIETNR